jgi:bifunctional DNA-binding transcriptional regulator/antitoxin component of YhaV-PrlF toxin-antitoxin module
MFVVPKYTREQTGLKQTKNVALFIDIIFIWINMNKYENAVYLWQCGAKKVFVCCCKFLIESKKRASLNCESKTRNA